MTATLVSRIPGAAQHEVMRCRPGIARKLVFVAVPDQRCTAFALHRVRDTHLTQLSQTER
jgi:hypothetical protein